MNIDEILCDLHDIQKFLELHKLTKEPKDNEGSGFTIGDVIEDLIYKINESDSAFLQSYMFDVAFIVKSPNKAKDITNGEILRALEERWVSLSQDLKNDLHEPYDEAFGLL
jgi:hypothetical protein